VVDAVLVPLTASAHSQRALPVARGLADQLGCPLHLVTSEHPSALADGDPMDRGWVEPLADEHRISAGAMHHHVVDDPRTAIEAVAEELGEAAVCLTTRARQGVAGALLGSTADAVVRTSTRPTVLVGPTCADAPPTRIARLLAPVDDSPAAQAIIDPAAAWSRQLGVPLTLLHVAEPPRPRDADAPVPADTQALMDRLHERALALQQQGTDADWDVLTGYDPAARLVEHTAQDPTSLLAMATHGRTGLARMLLGSVTSATVRRAPVPVLTLRPHAALT